MSRKVILITLLIMVYQCAGSGLGLQNLLAALPQINVDFQIGSQRQPVYQQQQYRPQQQYFPQQYPQQAKPQNDKYETVIVVVEEENGNNNANKPTGNYGYPNHHNHGFNAPNQNYHRPGNYNPNVNNGFNYGNFQQNPGSNQNYNKYPNQNYGQQNNNPYARPNSYPNNNGFENHFGNQNQNSGNNEYIQTTNPTVNNPSYGANENKFADPNVNQFGNQNQAIENTKIHTTTTTTVKPTTQYSTTKQPETSTLDLGAIFNNWNKGETNVDTKNPEKTNTDKFIPLNPNEYVYGGDKIEVNAPKRETNDAVKPVETDDDAFPIDIRFQDD